MTDFDNNRKSNELRVTNTHNRCSYEEDKAKVKDRHEKSHGSKVFVHKCVCVFA